VIDPIRTVQESGYSLYNPQIVKNSINSDQNANEILERAKSLINREKAKSGNFQATNLIFMAENALKNGNANAAINFANKAMGFFNKDEKTKTDFEIPKDSQKKERAVPGKEGKKSSHMYKDVSNDPGVSFAYASSLSGAQSFLAVPAHEGEHVGRAVSEAVMKGERVDVYVSYSVRYDPMTGEAYMAGGLTTVVKHPKVHHNYTHPIGRHVNVLA
jgi:hypothetical protein